MNAHQGITKNAPSRSGTFRRRDARTTRGSSTIRGREARATRRSGFAFSRQAVVLQVYDWLDRVTEGVDERKPTGGFGLQHFPESFIAVFLDGVEALRKMLQTKPTSWLSLVNTL